MDQAAAQTAVISSIPAGTLLRTDETTYLVNDPDIDANTRAAYDARNLVALPSATRVVGLSGLVAQSLFRYDENSIIPSGSTAYWSDPATPYRGNLTTSSRWLNTTNSYISTRTQYDQYGNVRQSFDALDTSLSNPTTLDYTGNQFAYPTSIASSIPDSSGALGSNLPLVTTTSYDFDTGLVTSSTDANNQTTSYTYNDSLNRVKTVTSPDGGLATYNYSDVPGSISVETITKLSSTENMQSKQFFDGLGRPRRSLTGVGGGSFITVDTEYDNMGRQNRRSDSYFSNGSPSTATPAGLWTTSVYDDLGRLKTLTTPDSAVVRTDYDGNRILVTDQSGRQRMSKTNGLGQLKDVWEITVADQATEPLSFPDHTEVTAGYHTSYSYDGLGDLTSVAQGAQQRTFVYDSLNRLTTATNPESGTINYQYDNNSNLKQKIDARGIVTTYEYDGLNRNITTDYSDTITVNPDVTRAYDNPTTGANGLGRLCNSYTGGSESTGSTVEHQKIVSYDAIGRPLVQRQRFKLEGAWSQSIYENQRQYNFAGKVTLQIYPSGHSVSYNYDLAGRLADKDGQNLAFTGNLGGVPRIYSQGITYNASGSMAQEQLGTDTAIYNKLAYNSRGQLAEIKESTTPNDSSWNRGKFINWYSLQCGSVSSPDCNAVDNNGNLRKQETLIPNNELNTSYTSWSQQYEYDSLNRLTEVHEHATNNTLLWHQSYTYDRYGNRTLKASATSDGINKQSFEVESTTNRLLAPGDSALSSSFPSPRKMRYDDAGNLTNDSWSSYGSSSPGTITRTYDAENRMTSAWDNSGGISYYTYNADGQRVRRKKGSVETWQVYGMDGELLAEYAATASEPLPQKEYGYRNGQLLITAEAPPTRTNVALAANGGTTLASSSLSGYPASKVNDGDRKGGDPKFWADSNPGNFLSDWVEVDFSGSKTISEIDVVTLQDNLSSPIEPTLTQTFSSYGATQYDVEYLNGSTWTAVTGGNVTGNNKVWRQFTFTAVTTTKIRVVVKAVSDSNYSRIVELEAWTQGEGSSIANINWLVTDQLGTPRMLFDKTGCLAGTMRHDYLPFGEELFATQGARTAGYTPMGSIAADKVRQKFTQKERDNETGLDYFLARYYSSLQGRFVSVDQGEPELMEPQTWNRYQYARNNPLYYVDADGNKDEPAKNQRVNEALANDPTLLEVIKASVNYSQRSFEDALNRGGLDGDMKGGSGNILRGMAGEATVIDWLRESAPLVVSQPANQFSSLPGNSAPDIGAIFLPTGNYGKFRIEGDLGSAVRDSEGHTGNSMLPQGTKFGLYEVKSGFTGGTISKGASQVAATAAALKTSGLPGVAVLVVDTSAYKKLSSSQRAAIYNKVTRAGGYIQLYNGLAQAALDRSRNVRKAARQ
jgi:RHS repeat-associated protein